MRFPAVWQGREDRACGSLLIRAFAAGRGSSSDVRGSARGSGTVVPPGSMRATRILALAMMSLALSALSVPALAQALNAEMPARPDFVVLDRNRDGYISRVEATILPYLLLKAAIPTDYGFYTYQSDEWTVCYRRDTLEQPADRPGLWKLTTKLSDKKPPMVSYYNGKGDLMYSEMPDGVVWEPTTLEKITELWKSKNLPMEKAKR